MHILPERRDTFDVRFGVPEYGCIDVYLTAFVGADHVQCSETAEPFRAFLDWLEEIAAGGMCAAWQVREEGSTSHLLFLGATGGLGDEAAQLIVSRTADRIIGLCACVVSRRTVVAAFYNAFRDMTALPEYDAYHWEAAAESIDWDSLGDEELDAIQASNPFSGSLLRTLRSEKVEAFLARPPEADETREPRIYD